MRIKIIILFSFISSIVFSQNSQDVDAKLYATGNLFGKLLKLELTNNSSESKEFYIYPFYIPASDKYTGIIVPKGLKVTLERGAQKSILIQGYTTHIFKKLKYPVDYNFKGFKLESVIKERPASYDAIVSHIHEYDINRMNKSELIPFDYVLTHPGTHAYLGYNFDLEKNVPLTTTLLTEQVLNLENGYDRLHQAGKLVTHFNQDIVFEKTALVQIGTWICASGLEGYPLKKNTIKKILAELYENSPGEKDLKNFRNAFSRYENIIERLGAESRVFVTPEELDVSPQCLPEIVGYKATSTAVRIPSVSSHRYEVYPVRNQKFDITNDCLPCKIKKNKNAIILSWISSRVIQSALDVHLTNLNTSMKEAPIDAYISKINDIRSYKGSSWLHNKEMEESERIVMAKKYFDQLIKDALGIIPEIKSNASMESYRENLVNLQKYYSDILFMYGNKSYRYNLDCCNTIAQPSDAHIAIADSMLHLLGRLEKKEELDLNNSTQINSEFIEYYYYLVNLAAFDRIFDVFRGYANNQQNICIETPLDNPEQAKSIIEQELSIDLGLEGSYEEGRYIIPIDVKDKLIFKFNQCNCGKYRESTVKFLSLSNGGSIKKINSENLKSRHIIPKTEISLAVGAIIASDEGMDQYNGNGAEGIQNTINELGYDTFFVVNYGSDYGLAEAYNFRIENILDFRLSLAYELFKNFHIRALGTYSKGFVNGSLPIYYLLDPPDQTSRTHFDALIRSELHITSLGGGFRYYIGKNFKPFLGANISYVNYRNEYAKLYADDIEMELEEFDKHQKISFSADAGLRYKVNQDMFLDVTYTVINRHDQNANQEDISVFDYALNFGIGVKF